MAVEVFYAYFLRQRWDAQAVFAGWNPLPTSQSGACARLSVSPCCYDGLPRLVCGGVRRAAARGRAPARVCRSAFGPGPSGFDESSEPRCRSCSRCFGALESSLRHWRAPQAAMAASSAADRPGCHVRSACTEFVASMRAFGFSIVSRMISGTVMPVSASRASSCKRSESVSGRGATVTIKIHITAAVVIGGAKIRDYYDIDGQYWGL